VVAQDRRRRQAHVADDPDPHVLVPQPLQRLLQALGDVQDGAPARRAERLDDGLCDVRRHLDAEVLHDVPPGVLGRVLPAGPPGGRGELERAGVRGVQAALRDRDAGLLE
jgi:hypothetical protein